MARRISQLTALTSASLDTTLLGVDRGVSYKIELDVLADAVKDRINTLDDIRLDSLESFTASYSATGIAPGTISGSSQLTSSFDARYSLSGSVQNTILPLNLISSSTQITSLGFVSGSYLTSLSGAISSSSQLTSSFDGRYTLSGSVQPLPSNLVSSSAQISTLGFISSSTQTDISSLNQFTQSIDGRVDSLESWSSSLTNTFATDLEVSIVSSSVAATIAIVASASGLVTTSSFNEFSESQTALNNRFATTGSNTFNGSQRVNSFVSASYYRGSGRYLTNLTPTTNWNYDEEFSVKKNEQLTFSGDYILDNTYLAVEGYTPNSIGEWTTDSFSYNGTATQVGRRGYVISGSFGDGGASTLVIIKRYFNTATTMSVDYVWECREGGDDWPMYDVSEQEPFEPNNINRLVNQNSTGEFGTWIINVPANNWVSFGVWTNSNNDVPGILQLTFPYLITGEEVEYSSNKSFKKEGSIFIGGNLLVKDSYIENDGLISVGGEVILIGNSQIVGTGKII